MQDDNNTRQSPLEREVRRTKPKCGKCGNESNLKMGWTRDYYCSESCERSAVAGVHASMPGGSPPYRGWMPQHIEREIRGRWADA